MKTILIVDDEKKIREGLNVMIKRFDCSFTNVYEAKNGKEALEIINTENIDVVLTDIIMPIMNGIDLIKEISLMAKKPQVLILSGHDEFNYAKEAITYGVKGYLLKPVDREELLKTIKSLEIEKTVQIEKDIPLNKEDITNIRSIEKSIQYINDNYQKDIDLAVVSNYVSLNYYYFSQLFKSSVGMNFTNYLKKLRIEKSKELLSKTDNKIYEIATKVGFTNPKNFMKSFRIETGVSPKEYRNLNKTI